MLGKGDYTLMCPSRSLPLLASDQYSTHLPFICFLHRLGMLGCGKTKIESTFCP